MNRFALRARRWVAAVLLLGALTAAGCGGPSEAPSLVDSLPEDGELGADWIRASEPRVGDQAEASTLCGVSLDADMVEGAKIDLTRGGEFVSTYFRRYGDAATATRALTQAAEAISACPAQDGFGVEVVPSGDPGDQAFSAIFSDPQADPTFVGDFGWTLVRTGDVIRSLQYIPAPDGEIEAPLGEIASALAATN